jgi:hypothetical protein
LDENRLQIWQQRILDLREAAGTRAEHFEVLLRLVEEDGTLMRRTGFSCRRTLWAGAGHRPLGHSASAAGGSGRTPAGEMRRLGYTLRHQPSGASLMTTGSSVSWKMRCATPLAGNSCARNH